MMAHLDAEAALRALADPRRRQMLELARSFIALPRQEQEALVELARALAGAETDGEAQEEVTRDAA